MSREQLEDDIGRGMAAQAIEPSEYPTTTLGRLD